MSVRVSVPNLNSCVNAITKGTDDAILQEFRAKGLEIGEVFIQMCTKYVPWKTGTLAGSGKSYVEGDRIRVSWSREEHGFDVAQAQYYGEGYNHNHSDRATNNGLRTDHWDKAMLNYEGDVFMDRFEDILTR